MVVNIAGMSLKKQAARGGQHHRNRWSRWIRISGQDGSEYTANGLNQQITILEGNKKQLDWCGSQSVEERESQIVFTANGADGVYISIEPENFRKVVYLLNEINERQLSEAKREFDDCFAK